MVEAVPTGRFEWERLVRRIVMKKPVKLAALVLATYADPDGTRVRPGVDRFAAVTDDSERNARRIVGELERMQLITLTARGGGRGGRGKTNEYQLTVPADLLDRFDLLDPDERHPAADPVDNPETPDTQVSDETDPDPVDNSKRSDNDLSGETVDPPENDRTSGVTPAANDRTFSPTDRTPRCPTTTHITTHNPTTQRTTYRGESRPRARDPATRDLDAA